ncbi:MAG: hypothetical protein RI907_585, partial [Pseudomonadota bacterium]
MWQSEVLTSQRERLAAVWVSPRFWAMLSSMSNRGVGFIVSLSISRLINAHSLALYISTVIAAATVTAPFVQMLFNAGTVNGAHRASHAWLRSVLRFELSFAAWVTPLLILALGAMQWGIAYPLAVEAGSSGVWLVLVGVSAVAAQLLVAALGGLLNGMNRQLLSYRTQAVVSMATITLSFPAVWLGGMTGAWLVFMLNSWVPVLLLGALAWRVLHEAGPAESVDQDLPPPRQEAWRQIRLCMPNAVGVLVSGAATWLCTIKLVSMHHGAAGVATLAIANQWMTLILVPVTSWGGVQLRELVDMRRKGGTAGESWRFTRALLKRNLAVTGALVAVVLVLSSVLESAYRLQGHGLVNLLWVSALVALAATGYGVVESLLIAWERQWVLMRLLLIGLMAQVAFTFAFIEHAVLIAQLGALVSWGVMVG